MVSKSEQKLCWLVFLDTVEVGSQIVKRLELEGHNVITVTVGEQFTKLSECPTDRLCQRAYAINPQARDDYEALLKELSALDLIPSAIAHLWSLKPNAPEESPHQFFDECQNLGFYSLLFLAQALGKQEITNSLQILVVTNNVQEVNGDHLNPQEVLKNAMSSEQGIDAFSRILCRTFPQVVVSPENFHTWIEQSRANSASIASSVLETIEKARPSKPRHPRPQLSNVYIAPKSEVEQIFANIWQELLGIEQVGIYDNFFDLGGDSLV